MALSKLQFCSASLIACCSSSHVSPLPSVLFVNVVLAQYRIHDYALFKKNGVCSVHAIQPPLPLLPTASAHLCYRLSGKIVPDQLKIASAGPDLWQVLHSNTKVKTNNDTLAGSRTCPCSQSRHSYHGTVHVASADNPENIALGGFKESTSAYHHFRQCLGTAEEAKQWVVKLYPLRMHMQFVKILYNCDQLTYNRTYELDLVTCFAVQWRWIYPLYLPPAPSALFPCSGVWWAFIWAWNTWEEALLNFSTLSLQWGTHSWCNAWCDGRCSPIKGELSFSIA